MKKLILLLFCVNNSIAQNVVSIDSLKKVVIQEISKDTAIGNSISSKDYGSIYEIRELLTSKSLHETDRKGIFYFGLCGDDVPCRILLYDPWGYKIMPYVFNYSSLGDLLDFFERNQYSAVDILAYLKAIYEYYKIEDSWGEKVIIQ